LNHQVTKTTKDQDGECLTWCPWCLCGSTTLRKSSLLPLGRPVHTNLLASPVPSKKCPDLSSVRYFPSPIPMGEGQGEGRVRRLSSFVPSKKVSGPEFDRPSQLAEAAGDLSLLLKRGSPPRRVRNFRPRRGSFPWRSAATRFRGPLSLPRPPASGGRGSGEGRLSLSGPVRLRPWTSDPPSADLRPWTFPRWSTIWVVNYLLKVDDQTRPPSMTFR